MATMASRGASIAMMVVMAAFVMPAAARARALDGMVEVGGNFIDETGDRSTVQETNNLYEGFTLARLRLGGTLDARHGFLVDLRDLNLDSRQGEALYRVPGVLRLDGAYVQHRQVFDPERRVVSHRRDWRASADWTPSRTLQLTGWLTHQSRDGDRESFPAGTASALGVRYDNTLVDGQVAAELHEAGRGVAASYEGSRLEDRTAAGFDRRGQVFGGRAWAPMPFYAAWTNLVRASYGERRLVAGGLEHRIYDLEYAAVVRPRDPYEFRYTFQGQRVDDQPLDNRTLLFTNDLDATWYFERGQAHGGLGYETNDDNFSLTHSTYVRGGAIYRPDPRVDAKLDYAGRIKTDQQELTLMKDLDAYRVLAQVSARPRDGVTVGGGYTERDRRFPDVHVRAMGQEWNVFARVATPAWWEITVDYSHSSDTYADREAGFRTLGDVVTGRLEVTRVRNLRLAGGVTYLDFRHDLDIEKSLLFGEAAYTVARDWRLAAQYHVYNYDDYVLLSRYYTANIVQVRIARDLHFK